MSDQLQRLVTIAEKASKRNASAFLQINLWDGVLKLAYEENENELYDRAEELIFHLQERLKIR